MADIYGTLRQVRPASVTRTGEHYALCECRHPHGWHTGAYGCAAYCPCSHPSAQH